MGGVVLMSDVKGKGISRGSRSRKVRSIAMSDLKKRQIANQYLDNLYMPEGKIRTNKKLWEVLPANIWKGRRVFIVGGGTSLRGFDFNKLKGEIVVTVNRTFEDYPDSVFNVCQDARLWGWYDGTEDNVTHKRIVEIPGGEEARMRFLSYKGYKVWLNVQAFPFPEDIYQVDILHPDDFSWKNPTLVAGIPPYGNSGLNALNMVISLGAREIYLLGFDMYGEDGKTANYHAGYPASNSDEIYKNSFIPDFKDFASKIKGLNTKVINLNPKSALKCFEFGNFKDIPKIARPIVVSFYTKNTGYQLEINRLEESVRKFGLEYDFFASEDLGTWRKNIHARIQILLNFLDKHAGKDIVYIDADGSVQKYPELLDNFQDDFGIVKIDHDKYWPAERNRPTGRYEYLGGTMYLKNNDRMRALLRLWQKLDAPMNTPLSQHTLIRAIEQSSDLKIRILPDTYCQIFDVMVEAGDPVVEHFQASRRSLHNIKINDKTGKIYVDFGGVQH